MSLSLALFGIPGLTNQRHSNTLNYQSRIIANNGIITSNELDVVDKLVVALINANLWSKITTLWTPFGSFPNGVLVPLKHPRNSNLINSGFVASEYNIKTGLKGNNSSFLDTQTTENDYPVSNDTHIALQLTNIGNGGAFREVGTNSLDRFQILLSYGTVNANKFVNFYYRTYSAGSGIEGVSGNTTTLAPGFFQGQRNGSIASLKFNGSTVSSSTRTGTDTPNTTNSITFFRAFTESTDRGMSFISIGKAFSDTESLSYSNIVNSFQEKRNAL